MTAVDTNILVRLLTGDDRRQAAAAKALFAGESIWIAKTVLLETASVLRSLYGFEDAAIGQSFAKLLGLKNVHVEDERAIGHALALTSHGIDFADAIPLNSRPANAEFVSFDRAFVRRAKRAGVARISGMLPTCKP